MTERRTRRFQNVHFVGIGGAGMCGIAEVMLNLGYRVTGSDLRESAVVARLRKLGAEVAIGHGAENVRDADVVVASTAVNPDNPELGAARASRIPIVPRAEMLGELMRFREGIAIAGTHGKTTTTSLVASLLAEGGLDPTFVIGGLLNSYGSNARLGAGHYLVAEADESDNSFLLLQPTIAVVTNIDRDHMETFDDDYQRLIDAFGEFIHHLPFYGLAVVCIDDPGVRKLLPEVSRHVITYGIDSSDADLVASNLRADGLATTFDLAFADGSPPRSLRINLPGRHSVLNALAAVAVARDVGVGMDAIARALHKFEGIGRRFNCYPDVRLGSGKVDVVDDYAHHPTELAATISAARDAWPDRRLVLAFQPHRYSRTRRHLDDFARVLSDVDALLVSEVYPAGESPISGADGRALCRAVRARGALDPIFAADLRELRDLVTRVALDEDVVLVCGAGDVGTLAPLLAGRANDD